MIDPRDLRVVFMGTPEFSIPTLQGLIESGCQIVGVFTQPDRPKGRGKLLAAPPVKMLAQKIGLCVYQPEKLRHNDVVEELQSLAPDLIVVVAYGQILPQSVLGIPKHGCINVHASLLPKYRGAAPINKAIMEGETETGITTILMDVGLDTGDMLVKKHLSIGPNETAGELHDRLAQLGRLAMEETLSLLCAGKLISQPQDDHQSSYAPLLKKENGQIDWTRPAEEVHNHVRGLDPWPGAYTFFQGQVLKVFRTQPEFRFSGVPGTILAISKEAFYIACGKSSLEIKELQLSGRKRLPVAEFLRGSTIKVGDQFS